MTPEQVVGITFLEKPDKISFATGIGQDPRVRSLALDRAWMNEARQRRLQALNLDRTSYVVLVVPVAEGSLLLICRAPDAVVEFIGSVDFSFDIIGHLVTDPFDAMTVVDSEGRLVYISPVHESFFGLEHGEGNGRPVREVIENTRLDHVIATGKAEVGQIQQMKGLERVVSRVPISREGKVVGAVGRVMFKGPEQVEALSRRVKALESDVEFYRRAAAALRSRSYGLDDIVGDSPAMRRLKDEIVKLAPLELPILIQGESGTGKELVAHSLHQLSPRRSAPLVMVNAAALPVTLVESELFGYEAGAFTGADRKGRKGKFEQAAGGTFFLDEVADMPLEVQSKLLRVLQDRIVERLGGERAREVNFRLVTATNCDLRALVAEGKFRLDLYYRLAPVVIEVPPLRERREDIAQLVQHFLRDVADRHGRRLPQITDDALSYLIDQPWPGNARQLRYELERAFVFAENGRITVDVLTRYVKPTSEVSDESKRKVASHQEPATLRAIVGRTEADLVRDAMERFQGNKKRVAQELGISRTYLYKILSEMAA
jgi:transcriptional regulator with PAS, ATPase and Fis domain